MFRELKGESIVTSPSFARPTPTEYAPYHEKYVSLIPEGDIVNTLIQQANRMSALLRSIPEDQADSRYAPDKWSIKEVVGHISDCERIFAYRALRFARNDPSQQPGFEHNDYVRYAGFGNLALADLASEFECVRHASVHLFKSLADEAWLRVGNANGADLSVRALAHIIAGHELHHVAILHTRYLAVA
jgi:DinB superfamily